jgi:acetoin utilization deacetylase AcuC-like enzyme
VRAVAADAADEALERVLTAMHERTYLEALRGVNGDPVVMPELAPPGLEPDIPVDAALVAAAHEGVRTAITAAAQLAEGARYTYAVCRPPGHHAGPDFLGGYCYLNNAAAAVRTLDEAGLSPVGVLDLDLHYPNGTAVLVGQMESASLHSLHASPVTNVSADTVLPQAPNERVVAFGEAPDPATYLAAVSASIDELVANARALVVSLGYDIVAGDPHGCWDFEPEIFGEIGRLLAAAGLPVCVIQEGGYALPLLAECSEAFAHGLLEGREEA